MSEAGRELAVYAQSNGDLYRSRTLPVIANLQKKIASGKYDKTLALKLWGYVADDAAQRYHKEFGSADTPWYAMFSTADRREAAKEIAEYYEDHIREITPQAKRPLRAKLRAGRRVGNVTHLKRNPKKRKATPAEARRIFDAMYERGEAESEAYLRTPEGQAASRKRNEDTLARLRAKRLRKNPADKDLQKQRRRNQRATKKRSTVAARVYDNSDLNAAARGVGMWRMSVDELIALHNEHKDKEMFASKVIAEAARQVAISKGARMVRKK